MLKDNIRKYILEETQQNAQKIHLYKEEREYIEKHQLVSDDITLVAKDASSRFAESYIERGDKESEETIAEEQSDFLKQHIDYFKKHKNEFMYLEAKWFEIIMVDAVSFENDDVFGTYDVMLGLKLPKKTETAIRSFLDNELNGELTNYDLIFSQNDGLWDFNFTLNVVDGFKEDMTISEAFNLIYSFLFRLVESVEAGKV